TAVRSGASRLWMLSTANADVPAMLTNSRVASSVGRKFVMACPFGSGFDRRETGARAVLCELARPLGRAKRAADPHFFGGHAVEQAPAGRHRKRAILIVGALPFRMRREQRRHIGHIVRDHQLLAARADMECRMSRGMPWRVDEPYTRRNLPLSLDQRE